MDYHFAKRRATCTAGAHVTPASFFRSGDDPSTDWIREPKPQLHTYLSMFGGTMNFCGDVSAEYKAREFIAQDCRNDARDYRGRPLALAECARASPDINGNSCAMFPFFLDADIKATRPFSHDELVNFAQVIVVPSIKSHYPPDSFPNMHILVCAAAQPKDLSTYACPACGTTAHDDVSQCDCSVKPVLRPCYKTAVHYRVQNEQSKAGEMHVGDESRFPVVTSRQAVEITSTIYMRAIQDATFTTWGSSAEWSDWCDVAPVLSSVPSLRVLGTVKSSKCHGCNGRKDDMLCCIICNGSGKIVDDRPYSIVGCVDVHGVRSTGPTGADALHATSIRVTGAATCDFIHLNSGIPRMFADQADVDRTRSLLRNPDTPTLQVFPALANSEKRRLGLKPNASRPWRPRGNYRRVTSPIIHETTQHILRNTAGFNGHYADVVVVGVYEQPVSPYKLIIRIDGFNSTYCVNRGSSGGRNRGPGCHGTSRVYFVMDPTHGIRQRCFSNKPGASGGKTCKSWEGGPWHAVDNNMVWKIWPHKRADATATTFKSRGVLHGSANKIAHLLWQCIDNSRARDGLEQIDPREILKRCGNIARVQVGNIHDNLLLTDKSKEMYTMLCTFNLDEHATNAATRPNASTVAND